MKKVLLLTTFLFTFAVAANAQQPTNWERVVVVQTQERDAMYARQESELKLLIQIQQYSLEKVAGGEGTRSEMATKQQAEREKVTSRHSAERIELAKLHNQERMGAQPKPAKPPEAVFSRSVY